MKYPEAQSHIMKFRRCYICFGTHLGRVCPNKSSAWLNSENHTDKGLPPTIESRILYHIIPIRIKTPHTTTTTFAMIDNGSAISLINRDFAKQLNIPGVFESLTIEWTDRTRKRVENSRVMTIEIAGPDNIFYKITVRTLDMHLPIQTITSSDLKHIGIEEGDVECYTAGQPQIILGLDNATIIANRDTRVYGNLVLSKSALGWTLAGMVGMPKDNITVGVADRESSF